MHNLGHVAKEARDIDLVFVGGKRDPPVLYVLKCQGQWGVQIGQSCWNGNDLATPTSDAC
jgi:hypothetical protein